MRPTVGDAAWHGRGNARDRHSQSIVDDLVERILGEIITTALQTTFDTLGDVYPVIAMALALQARGIKTVMSAPGINGRRHACPYERLSVESSGMFASMLKK